MSQPIAPRAFSVDALPAFMALLQAVLDQHGSITLRSVKQFRAEGGMPATRKAEVAFDTKRVSLLRDLDPSTFVNALTHELTHLQRGPALVDEAEAEEVAVEDQAQTLLYGAPRPAPRRRHLSVVR